MRDYSKLRAFELADEMVEMVYRATSDFPREELYGLISQIRREAVYVPSNIVEDLEPKIIEAEKVLNEQRRGKKRDFFYLIPSTFHLPPSTYYLQPSTYYLQPSPFYLKP